MKLRATEHILGLLACGPTTKCLTICLVSIAFLAASLPAHGLCSEVDTANNSQVEVYYYGLDSNIYEIIPSARTWFQRTGKAGQGPSVSAESGMACYVNTIYNGNEVFFLTADSQGNLDVEQLWGSTFSATNLTEKTNAQAASAQTNLVGYIDPIAGTDNVFYLGTDQQVHVLLWSPTRTGPHRR